VNWSPQRHVAQSLLHWSNESSAGTLTGGGSAGVRTPPPRWLDPSLPKAVPFLMLATVVPQWWGSEGGSVRSQPARWVRAVAARGRQGCALHTRRRHSSRETARCTSQKTHNTIFVQQMVWSAQNFQAAPPPTPLRGTLRGCKSRRGADLGCTRGRAGAGVLGCTR